MKEEKTTPLRSKDRGHGVRGLCKKTQQVTFAA